MRTEIRGMQMIATGLFESPEKMPCTTRQINPDEIPGLFDTPEEDEAIIHLIKYSKNHNIWCGASWSFISQELRRDNEGKHDLMKETFKTLAEKGFIKVPGFKSFFPFFDGISPQVLCITPKAAERILLANTTQN